MSDVTIWNDSIYGLIFEGRVPNIDAPVRYISEKDRLVIFTLKGYVSGGGGLNLKNSFVRKISMSLMF